MISDFSPLHITLPHVLNCLGQSQIRKSIHRSCTKTISHRNNETS